jgi:small-conductance mechanosensitive channel
LMAVRTDVATLAASTATLSLSVERIVASLGSMQSEVAAGREEQRQLTASLNSQQTLLSAIHGECQTNTASTAELRTTIEQQAGLHKQLAATFLRDVRARLLSVEINAIKRVAEKPSRFDARLREFYDKHELVMRRELAAPMAACFNGDGEQRLESLVKSHVAESLDRILGLCDCQADELAGRIEECVSTWHNERPSIFHEEN